MNEGWRHVTLGEVATINPREPLVRGVSTPFIAMADVSQSLGGVKAVTHRIFTGGGARFRSGDVLIARITPCLENGKIARVPSLLGDSVGHGSTEFLVLRGREPESDTTFLHFLVMSPKFFAYAIPQMTGSSGRQRFPADRLSAFQIDLPPLAEQRRIAWVLGAMDDLIETNESLMDHVEDLLTGLFEEYRFDQPGESRLDRYVVVNPAYAKPKGEAPYVDMASLSETRGGIDRVQVRQASGGARFRNGDTLLARITPCLENGKTAYVDCLAGDQIGVGSTEFIVLQARDGIHAAWPYFLARSDRFREYVIRHMSGTSGRQRCSPDSVAAYTLAAPRSEALQAFGIVARPMFAAMRELREENAQLHVARNTLLPLLLSGCVSVREVAA